MPPDVPSQDIFDALLQEVKQLPEEDRRRLGDVLMTERFRTGNGFDRVIQDHTLEQRSKAIALLTPLEAIQRSPADVAALQELMDTIARDPTYLERNSLPAEEVGRRVFGSARMNSSEGK